MIFLCHADADKPIVEPIALQLRASFGQDQVFYDAWSIEYGDGIIDRMNEGLEATAYLFFFVTPASLSSGMVKLEWQNALMRHAKGKLKLIPVRLGAVEMPAILTQTKYLDLASHGLEKTAEIIERIAQGQTTFEPQHLDRKNLSYRRRPVGAAVEIWIEAELAAEHDPSFLFVLDNGEGQVTFRPTGIFRGDTIGDLGNGKSGLRADPIGGIRPGEPFQFVLDPTGPEPVRLLEIAKRSDGSIYKSMPERPW